MKIALTTVQVPFVSGGGELLAQNLKQALISAGHEAEIISIPFYDSPPEMLVEHMLAARLLDVNNSWGGHIDLCIGLKFPACFMPHENKIIWALHQHRAAYDLFDTPFSEIKSDAQGKQLRESIIRADNQYLPEAKRIYTISQRVSDRMQHYNDISSTPLYHPCPDMDLFYTGEFEDYILMPSRINITKRQMLALQALVHTHSNIKLYILGRAEAEINKTDLLAFIKAHHLEDRVRYFDFVSQEEKFSLYANARAVLFIPIDEDYGYITLEAMSAGKAVITASDSGGPLEFIENNKTGLITSPSPQEIAKAMDAFATSIPAAKEMGQNAKRALIDRDITWSTVVKELTK